jgi:toxin CptA
MAGGVIDTGHPAIFAVAMCCAAVMGFSIQHGGTCMVAAVRQVLDDGRAQRALALLECCLWVAALGLAVTVAGLSFNASPGYPSGATVVLGGAMLGLGAWLNGACVFGAIARIGNRELHFLLTPPGFYLGSLLHAVLAGPVVKSVAPAPVSAPAIAVLLALFAGSLLLSLREGLTIHRTRSPIGGLWNHRHATIVIGIAFVALIVVAGPWTYTEALTRSAHGNGAPGIDNCLLLLALLGGAVLGGWRSATAFQFVPRLAVACLAGGTLMGLGSALIPGGNDNLILAGLPWLQPHAWLAIATMALTIAAGLLASAELRKRRLIGSVAR